MRRKWFMYVILAAVAALAAGPLSGCGKKADQVKPVVEAKPVELMTVKMEKAERASHLSGLLQPAEESQVSFEAAGRILDMYFREGDRVSAGDILARLDATEYSLQLAQAATALDKARVGYDQARNDFARLEQLYRQGALSLSDYESAQNRLAVAEKDHLYARQAYSLVAGSGAGAGKNSLSAPISGTVLEKLSSVGQLVGIGTPVYRIGQVETLKVVLPVPDSEISAWKAGDRVSVLLYGDSREGKVDRVYPATNQGTGTVGVEVSVANPRSDWLPGQVVRIRHALSSKEGLFVPVEAVLSQGEEKPYVYLAVGEKAVKTPVTTGELIDNRLEILSGIKAGDQVIVRGSNQVFDGNPIKLAGVGGK